MPTSANVADRDFATAFIALCHESSKTILVRPVYESKSSVVAVLYMGAHCQGLWATGRRGQHGSRNLNDILEKTELVVYKQPWRTWESWPFFSADLPMKHFEAAYEGAVAHRCVPRLGPNSAFTPPGSQETPFTEMLHEMRWERVNRRRMSADRVDKIKEAMGLTSYELSVLIGCPWDKWFMWINTCASYDLESSAKLWLATLENHIAQANGQKPEPLFYPAGFAP